VHVFDVRRGGFVPAAQADNAGTGPYVPHTQPEAAEGATVRGDPWFASGAPTDEDSTRL
jgi:hypothetical protein